MSTIITRAGKGSILTNTEMDSNFTNLNADKVESSALGDSATLDVGTTGGTVAAGNHNHSGVYEPADATILKDADIGVSVQAFDATLTSLAGLTLTQGALLTATGADAAAVLAKGTASQQLRMNAGATAPEWFTPTAASSITLATPQATTSGTSIDFGSIPAGTKRITIGMKGVSTSSTSRRVIRLGTSGGIQTSAYQGRSSGGETTLNGALNWTDGIDLRHTSSADAGHTEHGSIILTLMDATNNIWTVTGTLSRFTSTAETTVLGGSVTLSGSVTTVRLTTAGGSDTFDAGSMNIAYE